MIEKKENTRKLLLEVLQKVWDRPVAPLRFWRGDFWQWVSPAYRRITVTDLSKYFMEALTELEYFVTPSRINDLIAVAKWEVSLPDDEEMPVLWDRYKSDLYVPGQHCVTFLNGVLDVDCLLRGTEHLRDHTPEWFTDQYQDFNYSRRAACPKWESFLREALPDEGLRSLLQMWFGYTLIHDTSHQKFLLVAGPSATGKSVMANILGKLAGVGGVSATPLQSFGRSFSLYNTLGKKVNIDPDMSEIGKVDEGVLKAYVGGDLITVERKYRDPVVTRPTARLVFCTNDLPHISDRSNATWRRMILIPFDKVVPVEKRNPHLTAELTEELPGIWNWALQGLLSLQKEKGFPTPPQMSEAIDKYKVEVSPVRQWLEEACKVGADHKIRCDQAYALFVSYITARGYKCPSFCSFGRSLRAATGGQVVRNRSRTDGLRRWYYEGLYVKPDVTSYVEVGHPFGPSTP